MKLYLLALLIFSVWQFTECNTECNNQTLGTAFCIKIARYEDSQWATCLTDAYIQQKSREISGELHHCEDRAATYCYYQCMLETHGKNDGTVYEDCRCDPNIKGPVSTPSPLPNWCYSPDGSSCSWYRQCLKQRYPCEEKDDGDYGIKYAEKFCQLYAKSHTWFSAMAQRWIDAVRKCLQVALVPLLRPWQTVSCKALKEQAFATHTPCYLNPGKHEVSYCDLPFADKMKVFWTIKSGFISASIPSVKGAWDVLSGCDKSNHQNIEPTFILIIQIKFVIITSNEETFPGRKKLEVDDQQKLGYLAGHVIDAIALQQEWQKKGVAWFSFASNRIEDLVSITALLGDRYTYEAPNSSHIAKPSHPANLNVTLSETIQAIKKGSFNTLQIGNGAKVALKRMNGCADLICKEWSFEVFAPSAGNKITSFTGITVYLALAILLEMYVVCIDF